MKEIAKFLGWVGVGAYGFTLLKFFIKYVNKKYINKLPKDKKNYAVIYRKIMKYVIKYHKIAGVIAVIALSVHFYFLYGFRGLSITGFAAIIVMFIVVLLGIYGVISKNKKKYWLRVHRSLSFLLIVLICLHLVIKR
ncbi:MULTISPECIES: hypothetical protein [Clostridium]|uniref:hypothetical protein n=1 Tax=Clostridium TaxID=1485 RepID=UPI0008242EB0|nr:MULTISPECIES: hypothetical protein [Clostridium]PJI09567.1 hypothetical protein CUB90_17595 [Clostridium sp. CT7]